jgi:DNA invertase Pin-like site-specific DNA recombinase
MSAAVVGYARTSTVDQAAGLEAQHRDLAAAGCSKIFSEQLSSVGSERPQLNAALDYVREGDTLVVTKPDRIARSTADLLAIAQRLKEKGVTFRILSMQIDTSTPTGKLMLTVLGGIAEFERELMLERQREGIAKAKAEGKYKGRAPTARRKAADVLRLRAQGKTADTIVQELGVSRSSVFRILRSAPARDAEAH